jgi:hypothetical protein
MKSNPTGMHLHQNKEFSNAPSPRIMNRYAVGILSHKANTPDFFKLVYHNMSLSPKHENMRSYVIFIFRQLCPVRMSVYSTIRPVPVDFIQLREHKTEPKAVQFIADWILII